MLACNEVAIIDLDVHQGDGTASIFQCDSNVFTCSLHCGKNFPFRKATSDIDVDVPPHRGRIAPTWRRCGKPWTPCSRDSSPSLCYTTLVWTSGRETSWATSALPTRACEPRCASNSEKRFALAACLQTRVRFPPLTAGIATGWLSTAAFELPCRSPASLEAATTRTHWHWRGGTQSCTA